MQGFSSSFLIFFYQVALGGLLALAATPFHELDRAFYKSTAGVLCFIAILGLWGKSSFYQHSLATDFSAIVLLEVIFHAVYVLCYVGYVISLWGERQKFRARSFAGAILSGIAGLVCSAHSFYSAAFFSVEALIYPTSFFLSALLLGSVTVGMLIGHWYLIDTGQSLDPFVKVFRFFVYALIAQSVFMVLAPLAISFLGTTASTNALNTLWRKHSTLLTLRVIVGQGAPLVLSWMIWRTLLIPHTMAATGLFYIALLGVFVGEILGRQILALSTLPF
ncbi:MAG: hypothetical protein FJ145_14845 [Deltaproteobacteria bacterium]|nr:hypothetical protein [Deltaproteobacteria bacterium]